MIALRCSRGSIGWSSPRDALPLREPLGRARTLRGALWSAVANAQADAPRRCRIVTSRDFARSALECGGRAQRRHRFAWRRSRSARTPRDTCTPQSHPTPDVFSPSNVPGSVAVTRGRSQFVGPPRDFPANGVSGDVDSGSSVAFHLFAAISPLAPGIHGPGNESIERREERRKDAVPLMAKRTHG